MSSVALCFREIIFLKSCILTGDEVSERLAVNQQSSTELPNQESEPPAESGGREELDEEAPSPSSREKCQQKPDNEESLHRGHSQITTNSASSMSHQTEEDECVSASTPTVTDASAHLSDLCHLQQTLENSVGGEDESECTEGVKTLEMENITTEENISITPSSAVAAGSAAEQEVVLSNQETEPSDETDACVCQENLEQREKDE